MYMYIYRARMNTYIQILRKGNIIFIDSKHNTCPYLNTENSTFLKLNIDIDLLIYNFVHQKFRLLG